MPAVCSFGFDLKTETGEEPALFLELQCLAQVLVPLACGGSQKEKALDPGVCKLQGIGSASERSLQLITTPPTCWSDGM